MPPILVESLEWFNNLFSLYVLCKHNICLLNWKNLNKKYNFLNFILIVHIEPENMNMKYQFDNYIICSHS